MFRLFWCGCGVVSCTVRIAASGRTPVSAWLRVRVQSVNTHAGNSIFDCA